MQTRPAKIRIVALSCGLAFAATTMAQQAPTNTLDGSEYLKDAKVSLVEARKAALQTYPGTIVAQELEKERGGSGLRYSFDIRKGKVTHEVGIDAVTGKVLENSIEGPDAD